MNLVEDRILKCLMNPPYQLPPIRSKSPELHAVDSALSEPLRNGAWSIDCYYLGGSIEFESHIIVEVFDHYLARIEEISADFKAKLEAESREPQP